ncbi:MAG: ABC transporter permease [Chloroflexi bacterium]|nr:ABC transporter permease [Chloroflexota bacterium]
MARIGHTTAAYPHSTTVAGALPRRLQPTLLRRLARFARTKPLGAAAAAMVILVLFLAMAAPVIAPYGPTTAQEGFERRPPGPEHIFGTDQFGRDIFSRVLYGSRVSLTIALAAVATGSISGALLGIASGYYLGKFDLLVQRFIDAKMAFPTIILAMSIVAVLGPSTVNLIIAIALAFLPGMARITRSSAISLRERQFVDAARAIGGSDRRIMLQHIIPNAMAPFLIVATAELGGAILAESSLSFLGLGTQEPNPSLGAMLSRASQQYFLRAPWMAIWPGVALSALVFGFNVFGDALRDVLDPRLRRG